MVFPGASLGITPSVQTASVAFLTGCRKLCLAHMAEVLPFLAEIPPEKIAVGLGLIPYRKRGREKAYAHRAGFT